MFKIPKTLIYILHILVFFFGASVMVWGFSDPQWGFSYHGQQTSQSRNYLYYMTVISGNTTIIVPQIGTEYLYVCDNNQTIWIYGHASNHS
ncbi:hypothetical protein vBSflM004_045 [Shigella phage vB_SflM_004]|nr:hypothetical protein vBSflM004_045 [Shigella phage vB_SflM_004]